MDIKEEKNINAVCLNYGKTVSDVYIAFMPKNVNLTTVFPKDREKEILSTESEKVKREKYCAWKLLEYALMRTFGYKITDLNFSKTADGKWLCDKCYFSISHSKDLVTVAVSKNPIGVDLQLIKKPKYGAIEHVLTNSEKKALNSLTDEQKNEYLIFVWSKKESAFKCAINGKFLPSKIDTNKFNFAQKTLTINGDNYVLNTCTEFKENIRYFDNVVLNDSINAQ